MSAPTTPRNQHTNTTTEPGAPRKLPMSNDEKQQQRRKQSIEENMTGIEFMTRQMGIPQTITDEKPNEYMIGEIYSM